MRINQVKGDNSMQSSIGLIGLGAMGTGIAASMSRAGLEFYVHDNDQTKLEEIRKKPTYKNIFG